MTAKEYLNQAREIDALIHSKLRELDYWRDLSRRISGSHFEEQHNPNRPSDAPFARCICKIDELERDISHMVDEYVDLQKSVSQAIDCVENNQEKLLLRYRYIDGRTWQKIAAVSYTHLGQRRHCSWRAKGREAQDRHGGLPVHGNAGRGPDRGGIPGGL